MKRYSLIIALLLSLSISIMPQEKGGKRLLTINPLNLGYRFSPDGMPHRTVADPVIVLYKDRYYLFGSHCSGYYYSSDLHDWTYFATSNLKTADAWAPAVLVYRDAIYYIGMGDKRIFKSTDPMHDQWEEVPSKLNIYGDPALFQDEDGRVYLYHGCSSNDYIKGFEVDPTDGFKPISQEVNLIPHNADRFGWEVAGDNNELTANASWNEGPCITRQGNYYYLMYATPGTEFTSYCSGLYVATNPLGPYTSVPGTLFSIKPGGFLPGAGHGHPFKDKYGNEWYVSSMIVADKDKFERRLGIFPAIYANGYAYGSTVFTDYPFFLPDKKVDFAKTSLLADMNLLSYGKRMKASSFCQSHEPQKAADENIKTSWVAKTGDRSEWLQMDLGSLMRIEAVQVCFADDGFTAKRNDKNVPVYQYIVDCSEDGLTWRTLVDRSDNSRDQVYELIPINEKVNARYLRVRNCKTFKVGRFSISDMRIFGKGNGISPTVVTNFHATRLSDRRRIAFTWDIQSPTTGYVIRWGVTLDKMYNATVVYGNQAEYGFFDRNTSYYFTIEAFNEIGKGKGCRHVFVN